MFLFPNGFRAFSITQVYRFFNHELRIAFYFLLYQEYTSIGVGY